MAPNHQRHRHLRYSGTRVVCALAAAVVLLAAAPPALAWHIAGQVFCDENGNGAIDATDSTRDGVAVLVTSQTASLGTTFTDTTDSGNGSYFIPLPDVVDDFRVELPGPGLPPGATVIVPVSGAY